jgi:CRISPR-associated protein Cas5h
MDKVIAFDIWGDYAHFKKFHTTASPLTFSIPPPTAIMGMLGAILGLEPGEYQRVLNQHVRVSVGIHAQVKKARMGINWIDTKSARMLNRITARTQILVEYLREPRFRIYALLDESSLYNLLKEMLCQHQSYYTLYLGVSECIANFSYVGELDILSTDSGLVDIYSAVPMDNLTEPFGSVMFEPGRKYVRERMPIIMNEDREVELYQDVIIETTGNQVRCNSREYKELSNGETIVFF